MNDDKFFQRWLRGIPYEVAFWRSYYGSKKSRANLFGWSDYGKPCQPDCFDAQQYIRALPHAPTVIDLGCALSYAMGNVFDGRNDVKVEYVDPLAPFYNDILESCHIDRPRITFGMIEALAGFYASGSVDLIHVRNALDHCANPMQGIMQSLICLRIGGVLYLNHFRNEAVNEGYRGFHQWNIDIRDGRLTIWNEDATTDVAKELQGYATVETHISDAGRMVAVIKKVRDIEATAQMREAARTSTTEMMDSIRYLYSFPNAIKYQWSRLWCTASHRVMRLLPRSIVDGIKSLLRKK